MVNDYWLSKNSLWKYLWESIIHLLKYNIYISDLQRFIKRVSDESKTLYILNGMFTRLKVFLVGLWMIFLTVLLIRSNV